MAVANMRQPAPAPRLQHAAQLSGRPGARGRQAGLLTRLDVSFNAVADVAGLDKLTQLRDLSLFSNRVAAADGLTGLSQLEMLSLGAARAARCSPAAPAAPLPASLVLGGRALRQQVIRNIEDISDTAFEHFGQAERRAAALVGLTRSGPSAHALPGAC